MQSEAIKKFVESILEEKDLVGINDDIKQRLADDLTTRLEDQILRALISELNESQLDEFEKLVDDSDQGKLATFFEDKNLPVQDIVIQAMAKFKRSYLSV